MYNVLGTKSSVYLRFAETSKCFAYICVLCNHILHVYVHYTMRPGPNEVCIILPEACRNLRWPEITGSMLSGSTFHTGLEQNVEKFIQAQDIFKTKKFSRPRKVHTRPRNYIETKMFNTVLHCGDNNRIIKFHTDQGLWNSGYLKSTCLWTTQQD